LNKLISAELLEIRIWFRQCQWHLKLGSRCCDLSEQKADVQSGPRQGPPRAWLPTKHILDCRAWDVLFAPHAFYATYAITLSEDAKLSSELRAPGAGLAGFGLLMLLGIRRPAALPVGTAVALTIFIAFLAGRLVGLAVDGMPSGKAIGALVVELVIAVLCLAACHRRLWQLAQGLSTTRLAR